MSQGTKYSIKQNLLNAVASKVFKNIKFLVSADKIQTAMNDIIESLWGKDKTVVLTITDANVGDYLIVPDGVSLALPYVMNIPDDVTHVDFQTTIEQSVYGLKFVSDNSNGRRLTLVGNFKVCEPSSHGFLAYQFTEYLYSYMGGVEGRSLADIDGQTAGSAEFHVETFTDFMIWNEIWFHGGY